MATTRKRAPKPPSKKAEDEPVPVPAPSFVAPPLEEAPAGDVADGLKLLESHARAVIHHTQEPTVDLVTAKAMAAEVLKEARKVRQAYERERAQ